MGSYLFSCLYMLDPIPQEDAIFKQQFFEDRHFRVTPDRKTLIRDDGISVPIGNTYMAIDGATEEGRNDYSAMVIGFLSHDGFLYILETYHRQRDPAAFLDDMVDMFYKWQCIKFAGQKSLVEKMLMSFMKKKQREEKIYMPFEPLGKNTTLNKEWLIKQLQPWYEGGWIWHNEILRGGELESELIRFPKARNDDVADAEQMLLEIVKPSGKEASRKEYNRNSVHMWKRRLKRAFAGNSTNPGTILEQKQQGIDSRVY